MEKKLNYTEIDNLIDDVLIKIASYLKWSYIDNEEWDIEFYKIQPIMVELKVYLREKIYLDLIEDILNKKC
jgi:hypothetical protein